MIVVGLCGADQGFDLMWEPIGVSLFVVFLLGPAVGIVSVGCGRAFIPFSLLEAHSLYPSAIFLPSKAFCLCPARIFRGE